MLKNTLYVTQKKGENLFQQGPAGLSSAAVGQKEVGGKSLEIDFQTFLAPRDPTPPATATSTLASFQQSYHLYSQVPQLP